MDEACRDGEQWNKVWKVMELKLRIQDRNGCTVYIPSHSST